MSIHVIVTFRATPERASALADLLSRARRDLPGVAGCRGAVLFRGQDDPTEFTLVEEWDSGRLHQAHLARVVASGAWAGIAAHLAAEPISRYQVEL